MHVFEDEKGERGFRLFDSRGNKVGMAELEEFGGMNSAAAESNKDGMKAIDVDDG